MYLEHGLRQLGVNEHEGVSRRRFQVGSMKLEQSDPGVFIGLCTKWEAGNLKIYPCLPDPWAAFIYDEVDNCPLRPWASWGPPQQKVAVVRALLCRAAYLSSHVDVFNLAVWEALVSLVHRALFPIQFVQLHALKWARTWAPRHTLRPRFPLEPPLHEALNRIKNYSR